MKSFYLMFVVVLLSISVTAQLAGKYEGGPGGDAKTMRASNVKFDQQLFRLTNHTSYLEYGRISESFILLSGRVREIKGGYILEGSEKVCGRIIRDSSFFVQDTFYSDRLLTNRDTIVLKFVETVTGKFLFNRSNCYSQVVNNINNQQRAVNCVRLSQLYRLNGQLFQGIDHQKAVDPNFIAPLITFMNDSIYFISANSVQNKNISYSIGTFIVDYNTGIISYRINKTLDISLEHQEVLSYTEECGIEGKLEFLNDSGRARDVQVATPNRDLEFFLITDRSVINKYNWLREYRNYFDEGKRIRCAK